MKASKDPFESTLSEQDDESPPESPPENRAEEDDDVANPNPNSLARNTGAKSKGKGKGKEELEEEEDYDDEVDMEEEEDNQMDIDTQLRNKKVMSSSAASVSAAESNDPHKMAKMQSILSQFTEEQMSRYESFRRSGFQKSIMKRVNKIKSNSKATRYAALALLKSKFELLVSITGSAKISVPMTIVVSGIAKMFVGELVETARVVMAERKDSGPIRPCHIRESYRRLKLEGKIPKRSVPRLFR